ncbi:MAG: nitroreductase [Pseudomonadota bacterium]
MSHLETPTLKVPVQQEAARWVDQCIESRRSIHRFLDTPVDEREVHDLLRVASRAPSGTNIQPWRVYALSGDAKNRLCEAMLKAHHECPGEHDYGYKYYPDKMFGPYAERQLGYWERFWGTHGVPKSDEVSSRAVIAQNYSFFGAPVALLFTIDSGLEKGSWFDYGIFAGNIMTAARARGLDTCPQVSVSKYHKVIREVVGVSAGETVICGMALGHADPSARINTLVMNREPVERFASFAGF